MQSALRILHLEDQLADTELVQTTLDREGFRPRLTRIETDQDFRAALKRDDFDLILWDYKLASFDGLAALKIAKAQAPDLRSSSPLSRVRSTNPSMRRSRRHSLPELLGAIKRIVDTDDLCSASHAA